MSLVLLALGMVNGQELDKFAREVLGSFGYTRPAFVLDPDQPSESPVSPWANWPKSTLVATKGNPEEAAIIIGQINILINAGEINVIFFVSPIERGVIDNLANKIGKIHPKMPMIIPHGNAVSFSLRLDSRLFFYKTSDKQIKLSEMYSIR